MDSKQPQKNGVKPSSNRQNSTQPAAVTRSAPTTSENRLEQQKICANYVHDQVQRRAQYIVGSLFGQQPTVTIVDHNCPRPNYPFIATVEISYKSNMSPNDFLIKGQFFTKITGGEYFLYEPVSVKIIEQLAMIGLPEATLQLLSMGQAKMEW